MPNFADEKIKETWVSYKYGSPDDFYITQFNSLLQSCASGGSMPFFDHVKKDPPENGLNREIMTDINKSTAELHSASIGAKENVYIFGKEAADLGLTLDPKKNMQPLLVCAYRKYGADRLIQGELNVAESGAKQKYQFMYNVEQFDERSQKLFKKITKERQTPEFFKTKLAKQKEATEFYKENRTDPELKIKSNTLVQSSSMQTAKTQTNDIFQAVFVHNLAQEQGGFDTIGSKFIKPENEIVAIEKMKISIDKTKKAIADGKLPADTLIRSVFQGQRSATLVNSKNVSLEHKYSKEEHSKAKENLRKIDRGISR